ncbi:hypothetical protein QTP88_012105 [Uroleucon formosanum]
MSNDSLQSLPWFSAESYNRVLGATPPEDSPPDFFYVPGRTFVLVNRPLPPRPITPRPITPRPVAPAFDFSQDAQQFTQTSSSPHSPDMFPPTTLQQSTPTTLRQSQIEEWLRSSSMSTIVPAENDSLIFGRILSTSQPSQNETGWADDGYENIMVVHMSAHEGQWHKDGADEDLNLIMDVYEACKAWDASTSHRQHFNHSPSIPQYIRILISNKRRARALYQRYRLPSLKRNFNNLSNSLKKILSSLKNQTQANYLTNLSSKDGSLWQDTKKSLRHQALNTPLINPFGGLASTDAEKAELLKNHLAKIFTPHSDIQIPQHTALVNRFLDSPLPPTLPSKYFTPNDIKNAIQNYSLKKSPGYDLITTEVAKCLPKRAIVQLTILINAYLRLAYFPQLWKFSIIIVFPKPKKPPDILSSYRPISLLPFFVKNFERLILKRILPYIFSNNIIPNTQFGFRASHATTHQLHRLVDAISFSLEKKKYCSCVFLDVSQAFDRVWHEGLLFKIKAFLLTTYFLLIKSYLTDRHFQVKFGSSFSNIEKISAGVPQGGILSPILYNVYAADQPTSPTTSVAEFADGKAIISVHEDPIIASLNLQNHLDLISVWYDKWRV